MALKGVRRPSRVIDYAVYGKSRMVQYLPYSTRSTSWTGLRPGPFLFPDPIAFSSHPATSWTRGIWYVETGWI
jgi:hypothetical protein